MGAWAQAITQTLGGLGNDLSAARQANQDRALQIAQQKAALEQIQQQLSNSRQEMILRSAPQTQLVQRPDGSWVAVEISPFGGQPKTYQAAAGTPSPAVLSDQSIDEMSKTLPSGVDPSRFKDVVRGYRDLQQYDKALAYIGLVTRQQTKYTLKQNPDGTWEYVPTAPNEGGPVPTGMQGILPASQQDTVSTTTDPQGFTSTTVRKHIPRGGTPQATSPSSSPTAPVRTAASGPPSTVGVASPSQTQETVPWPAGLPKISPARKRQVQQEGLNWATKGVVPPGKNEQSLVSMWMSLQSPPLSPGEKPSTVVKEIAGIEKLVQPYQHLQQVASQVPGYVEKPTGPSDVALLSAFVEATKPEKGFRWTQQEVNLIVGARGLVERSEALIAKGYAGLLFGPQGSDQRRIMGEIIAKAGQYSKQRQSDLESVLKTVNSQNPLSGTPNPAASPQIPSGTKPVMQGDKIIGYYTPEQKAKGTYTPLGQ